MSMKVTKGSLYINKTVKYLLPILKVYGVPLSDRLKSLGILAIGVHDCMLDNTPFEKERKLCILIDKSVNPKVCTDTLNWLKYQPYYMLNYPYGGVISYYSMVVIRFPEQYNTTYDNFLKGKYSNMYPPKDIETFFPEGLKVDNISVARTHARNVITKRQSAKVQFASMVNETFNVKLSPQEVDTEGEYDFPPNKKEEFFNYKS